MDVLRTPDSRFEGLPGFDFAPHYAEVDDREGGRLRLHYLDEGPADGPTVVLLHGEPSWCYLYRHMIPVLTAAGLRAVAPDLVGFGRSDKPSRARGLHLRAPRRVDAQPALRRTRRLRGDAGRPGLGWSHRPASAWPSIRSASPGWWRPTPSCRPARASRARPSSTGVGSPRRSSPSRPAPSSTWAAPPTWPPRSWPPTTRPSPTAAYVAGARQFPLLVPIDSGRPGGDRQPRRPGRCSSSSTSRSSVPSATATRSCAVSMRRSSERIPGAAGQPHTTIAGGGHFLQEDRGPELAQAVVDFVHRTAS